MLSATIIESSTTIPSTNIIAASDIKLIVSPAIPNNATEPSNDTGKLTATQNAVFSDKNTPNTNNTNNNPIMPLLVTISSRLRTYLDKSEE
jgi:hypothetical protein